MITARNKFQPVRDQDDRKTRREQRKGLKECDSLISKQNLMKEERTGKV
jgi:hypothetical protein